MIRISRPVIGRDRQGKSSCSKLLFPLVSGPPAVAIARPVR